MFICTGQIHSSFTPVTHEQSGVGWREDMDGWKAGHRGHRLPLAQVQTPHPDGAGREMRGDMYSKKQLIV